MYYTYVVRAFTIFCILLTISNQLQPNFGIFFWTYPLQLYIVGFLKWILKFPVFGLWVLKTCAFTRLWSFWKPIFQLEFFEIRFLGTQLWLATSCQILMVIVLRDRSFCTEFYLILYASAPNSMSVKCQIWQEKVAKIFFCLTSWQHFQLEFCIAPWIRQYFSFLRFGVWQFVENLPVTNFLKYSENLL